MPFTLSPTFCPFSCIGNILETYLCTQFCLNMSSVNEKDNMQTEQTTDGMELNTDENISGSQRLDDAVDESELESLKSKIDELNDRYLRQVADFDNYKRRNARERIELIQTAGREVIVDLLDVLDDSERAQKQLETTDNVQQIKEGVQLVFTKLRNTLSAKGLKPIEALNKDFNVDLHEAVTEIEAGEEMKGKVVAELQKGYYLNDKIIRFAKVVVGK
jgi:molecular chaperone GrpE